MASESDNQSQSFAAEVQSDQAQASLGFQDLFMDFTSEEWEILDDEQKRMYYEVMASVYQDILSLGIPVNTFFEDSLAENDPRRDFLNTLRETQMNQPVPGPSTYNTEGETSGHSDLVVVSEERPEQGNSVAALEVRAEEGNSAKESEGRPEQGTSMTASEERPSQASPCTPDDHRCKMYEALVKELLPMAVQRGVPTGQQRHYTCNTCGKDFCFVLQHNVARLNRREREEVLSVTKHRLQPGQTTATCRALVSQQVTHDTEMPLGENESREVSNTEEVYKCWKCPMVFNNKGVFLQHQLLHYIYMCGECGKSFPCENRLDQHKKFHSGERSLECEICGETFLRQVALNAHIKIHIDEKSLRCEECGLVVSGQSYLEKHMKIHTEGRPYVCDECGKIFIYKSKLADHKKLHSRAMSMN